MLTQNEAQIGHKKPIEEIIIPTTGTTSSFFLPEKTHLMNEKMKNQQINEGKKRSTTIPIANLSTPSIEFDAD